MRRIRASSVTALLLLVSAVAAQGEETRAVTFSDEGKDGLALRSPGDGVVLRLHGYLQADGRFYLHDATGRLADTFTVARARPILEATIGKHLSFRLMPDFAGGTATLQDAYGELVLTPAAALRVGKYKPPVGLERLQSDTDLAFTERALPSLLTPGRDVGVQLGGVVAGARLEYAVGAFDGVADNASADGDSDDDKDVAAHVLVTPWKGTSSPLAGLSLGLGGSYGRQQGTLTVSGLGSYRTSGQQTFFAYRGDGTVGGTTVAAGRRTRIAPQASFYRGPLGLLAESVRSTQVVRRDATLATIGVRAWQVTGIWVLTGEPLSSRWVTPRRAFDRDASEPAERGWGSVALVARFHALRVDGEAFPSLAAPTAVQEARAWALGIDWTLQRLCRLMLDYEVTTFSGRGATRPEEEALLTRLQIGW